MTASLAHTEVRLSARRRDPSLLPAAETILRSFEFIEAGPAILIAAGRIGPPSLRSLDAIHLASMLSVRDTIDAAVIYDRRLAAAARDAGLTVVAPGD